MPANELIVVTGVSDSGKSSLVFDTPEEFAAYAATEVAKWGALVRKAGVKPE